MGIYKKLLNIQKAVKGLKKDSKSGTGAFSYQYVSGTKVLSHIREHMDIEGVILKTEVIGCKNTPYTKKLVKFDQQGNPYDVEKTEIFTELELKFTWIDVEDGSTDTCTFFANGMNDMEKGLGSALTYGERYFLLKYFHIQTDSDDIDNPNRKPQEEEYVPPKKYPAKTYNKPQAPIEKPAAAKEKEVPKDDSFVPGLFKQEKESPKEIIKDVSFAEKRIGKDKADKVKEFLLKKHEKDGKASEIFFQIRAKYNVDNLEELTEIELLQLKKANFDMNEIK